MIFALDTNVLIDILYEDEEYHDSSKDCIERLSAEGFFVVSPEVYSELVAVFSGEVEGARGEVDTFLEEKGIGLEPHDRGSLAVAGERWNGYDPSGTVECPDCGHENRFSCGECGGEVNWREHIITDFLIGGHAEVHADSLVTRDRGYYEGYFDVDIVRP